MVNDPFADRHPLDLPYEENPEPVEMPDLDDALLCGGVVVAATVIEAPEPLGKLPGLVFRFAAPDGRFYKPLLLVGEDDTLAKLRPLIIGAVQTARRAAKGHTS